MKRVLLVLPFTALLFFYACVPAGDVPHVYETAVVQSLTATMWTPFVTPTVSPNLSKIKDLLNESFNANELEMTLDARYTAIDVRFQTLSDNSSRILHLDILCVCAVNSQCCTPERTFVVTMQAMKYHAQEVIEQMPDNFIARLDVACQNAAGGLGAIGAPWSDVKAYLEEKIDGYILGWHVTPNPSP